MKIKEKNLYLIAIIGAVVCFIGDNLLGYYIPASDFGHKLMCISFSYEWANVDPIRFVIAGFLGVISLIMMFSGFYGIYLRIKAKNEKTSKLFLLASFIFTAVGTMYHNVFAIAAYIYNKLVQCGFESAKEFTLDVFNTFVLVGVLAAFGYAVIAGIMFIETLKGNIYPKKWMCVINPFVFMVICIALSKILPQTAFVNGVFDLGQQSIGLFIVFLVLFFTCKKTKLE